MLEEEQIAALLTEPTTALHNQLNKNPRIIAFGERHCDGSQPLTVELMEYVIQHGFEAKYVAVELPEIVDDPTQNGNHGVYQQSLRPILAFAHKHGLRVLPIDIEFFYHKRDQAMLDKLFSQANTEEKGFLYLGNAHIRKSSNDISNVPESERSLAQDDVSRPPLGALIARRIGQEKIVSVAITVGGYKDPGMAAVDRTDKPMALPGELAPMYLYNNYAPYETNEGKLDPDAHDVIILRPSVHHTIEKAFAKKQNNPATNG